MILVSFTKTFLTSLQGILVDLPCSSCHQKLFPQGGDTAKVRSWIWTSYTAGHIASGPAPVRGLVSDVDCMGKLDPMAQTLHIDFRLCWYTESYGSQPSFTRRTRAILTDLTVSSQPAWSVSHITSVECYVPKYGDSCDSKDFCDPDLFSEWSGRFIISLVSRAPHH